uniref:Putative capsid protein n=1 Tax=Soybean thrips partiti-like virus 11 TaxID=2796573 RepID=A0A7T3R0M2_9VIRU|nr:putative capsid protein [Soybean thrips partiti-like virus 11]
MADRRPKQDGNANPQQKRTALMRKVGYKGKPENFDPTRVSGNRQREATSTDSQTTREPSSSATKPDPKPTAQHAPASKLPPPTHKTENEAKPTTQKNAGWLAESVYGFDIVQRELQQVTEFTPTYARLTAITRTVFSQLAADDSQLNRKMTLEMFNYYSTAILWARLLDIKAKRAHTALTSAEKEYRRYFVDKEYNLPAPIYHFLRSIGNIEEKRGKMIYLQDASLPVEVVGGRSGYFGPINDDTHLLYEEIPTLGVIGDVLMAMTSGQANPVPDIPIVPDQTVPTENLLGYPGVIAVRRDEIRQILNSVGITTQVFPEAIPNTRFNAELMQTINAYFASNVTFKIEKVDISALTSEGVESLLIVTEPPENENLANERWVNAVVQPKSVSTNSPAIIGSSYVFGFQLMKERFGGAWTNWSPVTAAPNQVWNIPPNWIANRNLRRQLPPNFANPQFVSLADSQSFRTQKVVEKLIVARR